MQGIIRLLTTSPQRLEPCPSLGLVSGVTTFEDKAVYTR